MFQVILSLLIFSAQAELTSYYPLDLRTKIKQESIQDKELMQELYQAIQVGQRNNISYKQARRYLFGELHLEETSEGYSVRDVYCQNDYGEDIGVGEMRIPNPSYMNCEHTWPQSKFNRDESMHLQKTDLHHLYPVDSRSNSSRSNLPMGEVDGRIVHENCSASLKGEEVEYGYLAFEPPKAHKGNVARAMFYFSTRYRAAIAPRVEETLRAWHRLDPVDFTEEMRNDQIHEIQGNRNPFIDEPELVDDISDF